MKYWILSVAIMLAILGGLYYVFGEDSSTPQYNSSSSGVSDDSYKNFHIP